MDATLFLTDTRATVVSRTMNALRRTIHMLCIYVSRAILVYTCMHTCSACYWIRRRRLLSMQCKSLFIHSLTALASESSNTIPCSILCNNPATAWKGLNYHLNFTSSSPDHNLICITGLVGSPSLKTTSKKTLHWNASTGSDRTLPISDAAISRQTCMNSLVYSVV
ncbi:hypothetical protein F5Y07DRAFT_272855 [Xylaria sp. FL0933]|nr:hypothetical protein F5Y07DRAFT_272855 [Xylaria sp. FL0933]